MRRGSRIDEEFRDLPTGVTDYVRCLIRMIGYRRKVRREVQKELLGHFADALRDCPSPEETQARTEQLIAEFGDPQLLAILCRRAKKRCRPLWLRAVARMRMAVFILLVGFSSYTAWFVSGKPVVTDEYLLQLNQLGRPQLPASDNAWPHCEKAFSLFVEPSEELKGMSAFKNSGVSKFSGFATISYREREAITEWVAVNEPAWTQLEIASHRSYCWRPHRYDRTHPNAPPLFEIMYNCLPPHLYGLVIVGVWKARLAAEEDRLDESIDDCLVIARIGIHWQISVGMFEQLAGLAWGAIGRFELCRVVAEHGFPATTLRDIQTQWAELYRSGCPFPSFEGERLVVLDAVQHTFTRGGFGGGHMIPGQFAHFAYNALELEEGRQTTIFTRTLFWPMDVGTSMIHACRNKTVAKIHEVYDEISERSRLSPYQRRTRQIEGWEQIAESMNSYTYGLVCLLLPDEGRVSELAFRLRGDHEATLAVLALKRYRLEMETYPPDLKSLVDAGYLRSIPMDPYSDGPLIYRRVGDEFLLYSVGPDFVDGGGQRGVDEEGQPRIWAENGDRVFWPLGGSVE